ncbi:GNAT family N-acetyltransferase [Vagococcus elongatus]|uniref:N-acetyltransferase domain-containing protein n=1 Tax=Vagococcus elongatus TaxID=180344 RepID=A0A430B5Y4_9ENTE|nr:GNAT family N-acetyltransferase [Vagococcus elongatus]RSU15722.1 hypothetical protein CBF29_01220 [Vagococcus elongatus]
MFIIRKAVEADVSSIEKVIASAVSFLKSQKLPQWQDGNHPSIPTVFCDIKAGEGYVLTDGATGKVLAYGVLAEGPESTYETLLSGSWLEETNDYRVIHRIAVDGNYRKQGLAKRLLIGLIREGNKVGNFDTRIDTHPNNKIMQRLVTELGFSYCGEINLPIKNGERIVYQMINTYF